MPRKLRLQYPGAIYHAMSRGDRREDIFRDPRRRAKWLRVHRLLGERGIPKDSAAGREEFGRQMEHRRQQEAAADYQSIRRGWCLGRAPVAAGNDHELKVDSATVVYGELDLRIQLTA